MSFQSTQNHPIPLAPIREFARRAVEAFRLTRGRARARIEADRLGHELGVFRLSDAGYEIALCLHCYAGISIHQPTAQLFVSGQFERPCEGNNRSSTKTECRR